jgi:hypothetical protein
MSGAPSDGPGRRKGRRFKRILSRHGSGRFGKAAQSETGDIGNTTGLVGAVGTVSVASAAATVSRKRRHADTDSTAAASEHIDRELMQAALTLTSLRAGVNLQAGAC